MRRFKYHALLATGVIALGVNLAGCAAFSDSHYDIVLTDDATVEVNGEYSVFKKRGEKIHLDGKSFAVIQAPGKMAVLVTPRHGPSVVKVGPKAIGSMATGAGACNSPASSNQYNKALNQMVFSINEVESLMAKGDTQRALSRIGDLELLYPEVGLFQFLKASCLIVLNEHREAKFTLEHALREYPDSAEGKALYDSLMKEDQGTP